MNTPNESIGKVSTDGQNLYAVTADDNCGADFPGTGIIGQRWKCRKAYVGALSQMSGVGSGQNNGFDWTEIG